MTLCRACNNTYILDIVNNKCNKCPSSCAVCSVYDNSVCLQCWDGWYVNSDNKCSKCDSVCSKCNGYGNCVELPLTYVLDNYLTLYSSDGNINKNIHKCP